MTPMQPRNSTISIATSTPAAIAYAMKHTHSKCNIFDDANPNVGVTSTYSSKEELLLRDSSENIGARRKIKINGVIENDTINSTGIITAEALWPSVKSSLNRILTISFKTAEDSWRHITYLQEHPELMSTLTYHYIDYCRSDDIIEKIKIDFLEIRKELANRYGKRFHKRQVTMIAHVLANFRSFARFCVEISPDRADFFDEKENNVKDYLIRQAELVLALCEQSDPVPLFLRELYSGFLTGKKETIELSSSPRSGVSFHYDDDKKDWKGYTYGSQLFVSIENEAVLLKTLQNNYNIPSQRTNLRNKLYECGFLLKPFINQQHMSQRLSINNIPATYIVFDKNRIKKHFESEEF